MANPKIKIISAKATDRQVEIRSQVWDETGKLLGVVSDALETDGSQTEEQLLEFVKRKPVELVLQTKINENLIEKKLRTLPEEIEILPEDLADPTPQLMSPAKESK